MSSNKFSYKYKQTLLLKHLISSIAVFLILATVYFLISIFFDNIFYIILENIFGSEFAHFIHNYEPAVIVYAFTVPELLVWIIIEKMSCGKLMIIIDNMDTVLDHTADTVVLPAEFSELQNRFQYLKMQNRERQRLSEMEAQKKSDSLTYLAHDIRTPLASVVGYLSLLCEAPDLPAEQRNKYLHTAFNKALQFEKLIDEFFDITRYNLSEKAIIKKQVDLCLLLEQLCDEFYPLLREKELQTELIIPSEFMVLADGEKIARVFNNVIKNAIRYSYPKTTIKINVTRTDQSIIATVANHGNTIPNDKLEHIFDKFYRADRNDLSGENGTGLGLAIAKEIMRMHNGTIAVASTKNTTTFTITLPIVEE